MFCQKDSYTFQLQTEVLSCRFYQKRWEVELKDSIFYPEGGGQPPDKGCIGEAIVVDVQKRDGHVYCYTEVEVPVGLQQVCIDWEHRFDSMQQHTGQHLLTALILERFTWKTVGFHISADVSTIDLDTPSISIQDCHFIEDSVQKAILEARNVVPKLVSREAFEEMPIRSRGVPEWVEGPIRLIEIEGLDMNNCGGTHVRNTSELQMFAIVGTEKLKNKTRLSFVYGHRVLKMVRTFIQKEKELNRIFQEGNHIERAASWAQERKEHKLEKKSWNEYRCVQEGTHFASKSEDFLMHFFENEGLDLLKGIMTKANALAPQKSYLFFSNHVLVAQIHDREKYNRMIELFHVHGGKGGGKQPMFQGKWEIEDGHSLQKQLETLFREEH